MFPAETNEKIRYQLRYNIYSHGQKRPHLELEYELPLIPFRVSVDMESIPRNEEEILFQSFVFVDDDAIIINRMSTRKWIFRDIVVPSGFFGKIRETLINAKSLLFERGKKIIQGLVIDQLINFFCRCQGK